MNVTFDKQSNMLNLERKFERIHIMQNSIATI